MKKRIAELSNSLSEFEEQSIAHDNELSGLNTQL